MAYFSSFWRLSASLALCIVLLSAVPARAANCVAIVGTSDVHGAIVASQYSAGDAGDEVAGGGLLALSGYVDILRREFGPRLLLADAGDLFQGTLPARLSRGEAIIAAFNAMGYDAATIGNHEFDFGPLPGNADRQSVLKARLQQANFPFLVTNLVARGSGGPPDWPNVRTSLLVDKGGIRIGLLGISTPESLRSAHPSHIAGIDILPPDGPVIVAARALRAAGAQLIVLLAHLGGDCRDLSVPENIASCRQQPADVALLPLLQRLPSGLVDVAIGGHTHAQVAHWVNGTATLQSRNSAEGFAWVHACLDSKGKLDPAASQIHGGQDACTRSWVDSSCGKRPGGLPTQTARFRGQTVRPQPDLERLMAPYLVASAARFGQALGPYLARAMSPREVVAATAHAMRMATQADFGLQNQKGARASLPAGPLHFGDLMQAMPFDNRVVRLQLTGRQLTAWVTTLANHAGGTWDPPALAGLTLHGGAEAPQLRQKDGQPLQAEALYSVGTCDYLAQGGDGGDQVLQQVPTHRVRALEEDVRDVLLEWLQDEQQGEKDGSGAAK